ncbi:hypothetical protein GGQ68_001285 [Sagittula marina]|uniref:Uncharacterized protein n=1 Tax=Sagittula marina TaxID=943940 RepID=A0A7W6DNT4_9RHOB|nr:hypothetical protein [Sagittula marina]
MASVQFGKGLGAGGLVSIVTTFCQPWAWEIMACVW